MVSYKNFQPAATSRVRENIEWSITYTYNTLDEAHPRVLLIGDSICNAYQSKVRERLADSANVTFWASSKCITDRDYFRELDLILDANRYDFISFNNGLHSLTTNRAEWERAYTAAVKFIRAKLPDALLSLTTCTPLNDEEKNAVSLALTEFCRAAAAAEGLPVIELFEPMRALDKNEHMSDVFHWRAPAVEMQADIIAAHVRERLELGSGNVQLASETGPSGAIS